jgi:hypothetical protein
LFETVYNMLYFKFIKHRFFQHHFKYNNLDSSYIQNLFKYWSSKCSIYDHNFFRINNLVLNKIKDIESFNPQSTLIWIAQVVEHKCPLINLSTLHINNFWSDSRIWAQISTPRQNAFYKHRLPIILGFAIVKANSLSMIV